MTEKELVKQAAEADLLTFIKLVAPHRVLGGNEKMPKTTSLCCFHATIRSRQ